MLGAASQVMNEPARQTKATTTFSKLASKQNWIPVYLEEQTWGIDGGQI